VNDITSQQSNAPAGYTPFYGSYHAQDSAGLDAQVFVNESTGQVIFAFRGDVPLPGINGAGSSDSSILAGNSPTAYLNAVNTYFSTQEAALTQAGYSTDPTNVFVSGASLGGYAAQYLGLTQGLGGAAYATPGLIGYDGSATPPSSFTTYEVDGDGVSSYSSNSGINWDISTPSYNYGTVVFGGSQANAALLGQMVNMLGSEPDANEFGNGPTTALGGIAGETLALHNPSTVAETFGITLTNAPPTSSLDWLQNDLSSDAALQLQGTGATTTSQVTGSNAGTLTFSDISASGTTLGTITSSTSGSTYLTFANWDNSSGAQSTSETQSWQGASELSDYISVLESGQAINSNSANISSGPSVNLTTYNGSSNSYSISSGVSATFSGNGNLITGQANDVMGVNGLDNNITDDTAGSTVNLGIGAQGTANFLNGGTVNTSNNNTYSINGTQVQLNIDCVLDDINVSGANLDVESDSQASITGTANTATTSSTDTLALAAAAIVSLAPATPTASLVA
jgi:hypothetical protein